MQSPTASRLEGGNIHLWLLILQSTTGFPTSNCPRDQQQTRQLVEFQRELTVSADPPLVQAAFRAGLGAQWTFLSDEQRVVIKQLNILDETEGEYACRSQPYTLVLVLTCASMPSTTAGTSWGGPPPRSCGARDLRATMQSRSDYRYEAYDTPEVRRVRILSRNGPEGHLPWAPEGCLLFLTGEKQATCESQTRPELSWPLKNDTRKNLPLSLMRCRCPCWLHRSRHKQSPGPFCRTWALPAGQAVHRLSLPSPASPPGAGIFSQTTACQGRAGGVGRGEGALAWP